jgi:predicted dehydrogenase/threonine dehydrogenase-like Zn-dependent dehydrogenase
MKQLLQRYDTGEMLLVDVPVPAAGGVQLVIESHASVISPGTERSSVELGRASLLEKARRRPDQVRQVLEKVRTDGFASTFEAVNSKLREPVTLGYCNAGVVIDTGPHVRGFAVGDRVVTNGPHGEYVRVPHTLAARIPANVDFDEAAFTPLAAIALQGIRLAGPTLGETVVVFGLGAIGLLAVQLLRANGCRVIGIDRAGDRLALGERFGARCFDASEGDVSGRVSAATGGAGADAVLLTLAGTSDEPVHQAAEMSRKRGRLVLVGVTGLGLRRDDFYRKELSFSVSCSYGPGRYDPIYEDEGHDYPIGFVRWTEQRNFEAVLHLMSEGTLDVRPLITHRFPFDRALDAYALITGDEPSLGVVLEYADRGGAPVSREQRVHVIGRHDAVTRGPRAKPRATGTGVAGVIGAGAFAQRTLLPAMRSAGFALRMIASGQGTSAALAARKFGFEIAATDIDALLEDEKVDTVFVLTRHDSHARLALRALEAGKHVFVEKPLALREEDLDAIAATMHQSGRLLTVGFNRRFAPLSRALAREVNARTGPLALVVTVNAGQVPRGHWTQHPEWGGGRIVGEGCHFIDLARSIVGAPIADGRCVSARAVDGGPIDDIANMQLTFADGSTAAIHYIASGSRSFPKERIEAFFDGRTLVIENWRRMRAYGGSAGPRFPAAARQDKGHAAEIAAWLQAVRTGGAPPIPVDELLEVSRWSLRLAAQARGADATPVTADGR